MLRALTLLLAFLIAAPAVAEKNYYPGDGEFLVNAEKFDRAFSADHSNIDNSLLIGGGRKRGGPVPVVSQNFLSLNSNKIGRAHV